jgi:hypothetical protein
VTETIAQPTPTKAHNLTWQKLILGDWTRLIRDPLDVVRIAFVASTIVWIMLGHAMTASWPRRP